MQSAVVHLAILKSTLIWDGYLENMDFKANTIVGICACDDEFDVVNGQCIPPLPAIA